jgi:hypothetical protein
MSALAEKYPPCSLQVLPEAYVMVLEVLAAELHYAVWLLAQPMSQRKRVQAAQSGSAIRNSLKLARAVTARPPLQRRTKKMPAFGSV